MAMHHVKEGKLTQRSRIVVVLGEVLLLGQDVVNACVLIEEANLRVGKGTWRWLLHASVHHHCHRVVCVCTKLLNRLYVAWQLLRAASDAG